MDKVYLISLNRYLHVAIDVKFTESETNCVLLTDCIPLTYIGHESAHQSNKPQRPPI